MSDGCICIRVEKTHDLINLRPIVGNRGDDDDDDDGREQLHTRRSFEISDFHKFIWRIFPQKPTHCQYVTEYDERQTGIRMN